MRRIRIHAAASEEAAAAAAWYEQEHPGLGGEFLQALDAALDLLEQEVGPLLTLQGIAGVRGLKRLLLRRFPYAIIVRETEDETLVIAFAHTARRPGYWSDRLKRRP